MEREPLRLLMVDDDEDDFVLIRQILHNVFDGPQGTLEYAPTCAEALQRMAARHYDVFLFDYRLGAEDGIRLIREIKARNIDTPVILLTGQGGEDVAVEAMKAGAI